MVVPATLQAEDAELLDVEVSSEVEGYAGSGYVTEFGEVGDRVTFDLCVAESGYYTLDFRYAQGSDRTTTRTLTVDLDEVVGPPSFVPQWNWEAWVDGGRRSVYLDAGRHTIGVAFTAADVGELRLDAMTVSKGPRPSEEHLVGQGVKVCRLDSGIRWGCSRSGFIGTDCTPDRRVDASSVLMWVFGLFDVERDEVTSHRHQVLRALSPTD